MTLILMLPLAGAAQAETARFSVTDQVAAPAARAVTATIETSGEGARFFPGGDFEPIVYRNWMLASADSAAESPGHINVTAQDIGGWDVLRDGALDGAEIEVLRIENGQFREVRRGVVAPDGYAVAGWFAATGTNAALDPDLNGASVELAKWERPGVPRWFTVRAYDSRGRLSQTAAPVRVDLPDDLEPPEGQGAPDRTRERPPTVENPDAAADPRGPLAPEGLTAQVGADKRINLNWTLPPDDDDIVGIVVYQSYVPPERMRGFGITLTDADTGEPVRKGDLIILRTVIDDWRREKLVSDRVWTATVTQRWLRRSLPGFIGEAGDASWAIRRHDPDPLRQWGGLTYLETSLPGRSRVAIQTYNHAGTDQDWYDVLRPGVEYTVSARLRGERAGRAQFRLLGPYRDLPPVALDYGTEWREVTATFTVPEALTAAAPVGQMELMLQGPGRVDLDDLRVRRSDTPFLALDATDRTRLRESGVSALRMHGMSRTGTDTYDLGSLLRTGGFRHKGAQMAGMPDFLGWSRDAGADPWLQIEPHLTAAEWLGLVEYLAAPFDPATDSAGTKPWAALRAAQGQTEPWSDRFGRIYLELGNETWNRLFAPWIFPQMTDAATGETYGAGDVYGLYQAHVARILKSSPWWQAAGLDDKVEFVIGGWAINDYGTRAAIRAAPAGAADLLSIAAYNGGWDEAEGPVRPDRASYENLLNQVLQTTQPRTEALAAGAAEVEARTGHRPEIGTYEAGPGYAMDGLNNTRLTPEQQKLQEQVMKGRAAGVATLDTFLMQRQLGMTVQNFFTFGEGEYWRSHAQWYRGGAPYPSWSLLSVLNHDGGGEMLEVATRDVPRQNLRKFERRQAVRRAPRIAVYATRQGNRLTVFAISRLVPETADDSDACTPVQVDLPVSQAASVRLIRTAGALGDNPLTGPAPVIEDVALDPALIRDGRLMIGGADSGAPDCGLPGASAYIYVIEEVAP